MNKERILLLADMIENSTPPTSKPNLGFNMATYFDTSVGYSRHDDQFEGCGTVGCIAGWACFAFDPDQAHAHAGGEDRTHFFNIAREHLDLDAEQAENLFKPRMEASYDDLTPSQAAQVMRQLVETGRADWKSVTE
jgi:hypothetical protein